MPTDQLLPHDITAEEAVLGAILMVAGDPQGLEWIQPVYALITPRDFYRERNGWVLEACYELRKRGIGVDIVTAETQLRANDRLDDVGGPAYLTYLISRVPTPYHAVYYAEIVKDQADRRRKIDEAGRMAADAWSGKPLRKPDSTIFDL